jgi:hypothetical protein
MITLSREDACTISDMLHKADPYVEWSEYEEDAWESLTVEIEESKK